MGGLCNVLHISVLIIFSMKVIVRFSGTKIMVPCGAGDISVGELTGMAVSRYKRALEKDVAAGAVSAQDYCVSVHSLRYWSDLILLAEP